MIYILLQGVRVGVCGGSGCDRQRQSHRRGRGRRGPRRDVYAGKGTGVVGRDRHIRALELVVLFVFMYRQPCGDLRIHRNQSPRVMYQRMKMRTYGALGLGRIRPQRPRLPQRSRLTRIFLLQRWHWRTQRRYPRAFRWPGIILFKVDGMQLDECRSVDGP